MIRAAIAGLGRWGRNLVEASRGHARLTIVRAIEPDIEAARSFSAQHRLELTSDLDSVLADKAIDAVLLATPHSLHPAQVIACAAARYRDDDAGFRQRRHRHAGHGAGNTVLLAPSCVRNRRLSRGAG